ncbi:LLM class flavin-dependent oxidoreductase [Streptomyces flavofungini]|uniref:LLM class flavin-dependent oxidoreductase n=1 Tax=Streptomyces flavofungini TaxID=68200 RepID=A0ABS0X7K6_9ACTN|nr:LLM class flavin-dependent oxidoreductase [Streptomyces flavofungini]MBJ3809182.1 LLM class flavin-dependent oxidoreductase [Streptomyces flavofungini]GHC68975.1 5,10-methylenetetrahydromethanopterin reductase [Streptomyces flavofungini]
MRTGIVTTAGPGVEHLAVRAEELGFDSFWVYDSPMVHGDPFVSLALCARATRRIRLGIGVTSPALRSAPAAAAAVSSLNALAPGRIVCGVGTGNTARRALAMRPTKTAELESFTATLQDLTAGRESDYHEGTRSSRVRFLHVGPYVNTEAPVEFVVAAFGLKAAAVAGRLGAGVISFGMHDPAAWSAIGQARRAAARDAGSSEKTRSYLMSSLHVLADGEDRYGDPVKDSMGHIALSALILGAENPAFRAVLPREEAAAVDRLLQLRGTTPTDPQFHQALYRNYLGRLAPEDRELIVPSLVDKFGLVGTRAELTERINVLEKSGVDELVIQPVVDPPAEMAEFARLLA